MGGLLFVYFVVYQTWVREQQAPPPVSAPAGLESSLPAPSADAANASTELPALPEAKQGPVPGELPAAGGDSASPQISVATDVFELAIDTRGGDIRDVRLLHYPHRKSDPDDLVVLLQSQPGNLYAVHTGLRTRGSAEEPNHLARFVASSDRFTLADGADELVVPLTWTGSDGLIVTKTYRFARGSYRVAIEYGVENGSGNEVAAASYVQIARSNLPPKRSMTDVDSYSFTGPVLYDGSKYEKLDADDLVKDPIDAAINGGWIASIQHHFLTALVPPAAATYSYNVGVRDGTVLQSAIGPVSTLAPGASEEFAETLFVGPKVQDQLEETADGLKLTVDYGMLTIIAQPLFWVLNWLYKLTGNWGWAIILLTVLIKIAFYKLQETSGRSMAKMRKMQPRIKHLQERYADDRQALSKAMMELYRKEKINPGLRVSADSDPDARVHRSLLGSSRKRRAAPGAVDAVDRRPVGTRSVFHPAGPDGRVDACPATAQPGPAGPGPGQSDDGPADRLYRVLRVLPGGLVIYWFTNNLLSIAQQWRINKVVRRGLTGFDSGPPCPPGHGPVRDR